jgi:tRNA (guanine-N7-)-methyltransferase
MRLKNIPRARGVIAESRYVEHTPEERKGQWRAVFGNDHPLHLEIGTGKGRFIIQMAQLHPEINYIGIEKYSSVLLRGVEMQEELQLPNVRFIRGDAELICAYFDVHEIDQIYLNFSDPWPKKRTASRRLPSHRFLARYNVILQNEGQIEFKTDNRDLFEFAVEEVPGSSFRIDAITYDLHADPVMGAGNVMTEYEEKFSAKGNKINKYILKKTADARTHLITPEEISACIPKIPLANSKNIL